MTARPPDGRPGPVRTAFLGSGAFGRASLRRLAARDDVDVVVVVTAPPRPSGRGGRETPTVIDELATSLGLHVEAPARLRDPASIDRILTHDPDLVVLADYGRIVPAALLDRRFGALNLHPSLLPRHRGATPVAAAIAAGDGETGVTLMRMDAGLDTGPIVAQVPVALDGSETTPSLEAHLEVVAADLLDARLGPWLRGALTAEPQPEAGVTLTRPFRREDGRLDPERSAAELERQVRAMQPWPGSFVDTPVGRLVVWSAEADTGGGPPRGVVDVDGIGVGVGERLRLLEVQPGGGRRMTWDAFLRGRPAIVGASLDAGPGSSVR